MHVYLCCAVLSPLPRVIPKVPLPAVLSFSTVASSPKTEPQKRKVDDSDEDEDGEKSKRKRRKKEAKAKMEELKNAPLLTPDGITKRIVWEGMMTLSCIQEDAMCRHVYDAMCRHGRV
jgi:hypothetical protein